MEEDGAENGELLSLRDNEDVGGSAGGEGNGGGGGGPSVGYGGAELDMTVATIQTKTEEKRRDSKNSSKIFFFLSSEFVSCPKLRSALLFFYSRPTLIFLSIMVNTFCCFNMKNRHDS